MFEEEITKKIYLANIEFHNELTPLHRQYLQDEITLAEFEAGIRELEEFWGKQLTLELEPKEN